MTVINTGILKKAENTWGVTWYVEESGEVLWFQICPHQNIDFGKYNQGDIVKYKLFNTEFETRAKLLNV
jgi:hypothetical protein